MKKGKERIFIADPAELARACEFDRLYRAHKIPRLKAYLISLTAEEFTDHNLRNWFVAKGVDDLAITMLLSREVNDPTFASDDRARKLERCLQVIDKRYQADLLEQYEHLIQAVNPTTFISPKIEECRARNVEVMKRGLWINGIRCPPAELAVALIKLGLENEETIHFLEVYLSHFLVKSSEYYEKILLKIDISVDQNIYVTSYLEYDSTTNTLMLHFVQSYRNFYEIEKRFDPLSGKVEESINYNGDNTANNHSPIIAQSTVSFRVVQNARQGQAVELYAGFFDVFDTKKRAVIIKDLARHCAKKILEGEMLDSNDGLIIDHLIADCLDLTDNDNIIRWLVENKDPLKIFLVARINRAIYQSILQTHDLLTCLCADPFHRQYLVLLKYLYPRDSKFSHEILLMLEPIDTLKVIKHDRETVRATIPSYFSDLERCTVEYWDTPMCHYDLCLMSDLPNNDIQKAKESVIYLSPEGEYIVRDPNRILQRGSFSGIVDVNFSNLTGKPEDEEFHRFKNRLLALTSEARHTRQPLSLNKIVIRRRGAELDYMLIARCGEHAGDYVSEIIPAKYYALVGGVISSLLDNDKIKPLKPILLSLALERGYIRKSNAMHMVAVLHTLAGSGKDHFTSLLSDAAVMSQFKESWIIGLALVFEEVAVWLIVSQRILTAQVTSQLLCDLLRIHPVLWLKIQESSDENVRALPSQLLTLEQLKVLLLENKSSQARKYVKKALEKDWHLFARLCDLQDSCPNELLIFFSKTSALYRNTWEREYSRCEHYLLEHANKISIEAYYRSQFGSLDIQSFSHKFKNIFIESHAYNGSENSLIFAKKVLMLILVGRINKRCDFGDVCSNDDEIDGVVRLLEVEPRLGCLLKMGAVRKALLASAQKSCVRAFVDCFVRNYSHPDLRDPHLQISVLSLLSSAQLRFFLQEPINSRFMVNLITKELSAVAVLIAAEIPCESDSVDCILREASFQLQLMLLLAITSREIELQHKIASYTHLTAEAYQQNSRRDSFLDFVKQIESQQAELKYIKDIKQKILNSKTDFKGLLGSEECLEVDIACIMACCPEIQEKLLEAGLHQRYPELLLQQQKSICYARSIIVSSSEIIGNVGSITTCLEELLSKNNRDEFTTLLNNCLMIAFTNNDVSAWIRSTAKLSDFVVHYADLRLLAKFICLFGKYSDSPALWLPFFNRLVSQPTLFKIYGHLLHFHYPESGKLLFGAYAQAAKRPPKSNFILSLMELDEFNPRDYLKLLLFDYQLDGKQPYRHWLMRNSRWLDPVISIATPEDLAVVLIGEIRIRQQSQDVQPTVIESAVLNEPVFSSILRLSGEKSLCELLQLDNTLIEQVVCLCKATIMNSVEGALRGQVLKLASLDHLIELVTSGLGSPPSIKSCFSAMIGLQTLSPSQLLELLIVAREIDPYKKIEFEWGALVANVQIVCEYLLDTSNADSFILKAIPVLLDYYPKSASLIRGYLEKNSSLTIDSLEEIELNVLVEFLVSAQGLESVFSTNATKISSRFGNMICRLFFACDEVLLDRFSVSGYVGILVDNLRKFSDDVKHRQSVIVPKIIAVLIRLFERDPMFVEQKLSGNKQLVRWIKSSQRALCLLLSSPMYECSRTIRQIFDNISEFNNGFATENSPLREIKASQSSTDSVEIRRPTHVSELIVSQQRRDFIAKPSSNSETEGAGHVGDRNEGKRGASLE
jgi:hypothetical protein